MLVRTHKIIAVELTPNHGVRYPLTKPTPKSVYTDYNRTSTTRNHTICFDTENQLESCVVGVRFKKCYRRLTKSYIQNKKNPLLLLL